jgi:hypothetical protein
MQSECAERCLDVRSLGFDQQSSIQMLTLVMQNYVTHTLILRLHTYVQLPNHPRCLFPPDLNTRHAKNLHLSFSMQEIPHKEAVSQVYN